MSEIYLGRPNQKIVQWCKEHYGPKDPGPLCFTAEEAGSTITLDSMAECAPIAEFYPNMNLQYSRDGNTWTAIDFTKTPEENTITLANVGDKVYFKAITENPVDEWDYGNSNPPCRWIMTGLIAAAGNIQSLLDSTYQRTDVPDNCYSCMFSGCTSLTQAPELPATTLANSCYSCMFADCISLTQAPALPATTLADSCYNCMFANCWKLTSINVNFSAWNPASATGAWMSNAGSEVTSEKTFTCPSTLPQTRGKNNILEGWTIVTK